MRAPRPDSRPQPARHWRTACFAAAVLLVAGPRLLAATAPAPSVWVREHDIKAAFLFRFLQLVEWPEASFASTNSPIIVGLLKPDPFGSVLDRALQNERIGDRPIQIRRGSSPADLLPCHLLFVPRASCDVMRGLPPPSRQGVLTVGESPGFLQAGGTVNFYMEGNQVRFEINTAAANETGIRIRSRLLRLGRIEGGVAPQGTTRETLAP